MWDTLEEASIYYITSTSKPSGTIATHLASQNTLRRKHILGNHTQHYAGVAISQKRAYMNTNERFHIHAEFAANNNLNDDHTLFPNAIFDTLLKTHQP
jgi:hypothetical protein